MMEGLGIGGLGPFDLKGPEFLALYGMLFVLTVVAGIVIPRWLKPAGTWGEVTDPDQAAFLAAGAQRYAEALVARLLDERAVGVAGKRLAVLKPDAGRTKGELAVLRLSSPASWTAVTGALNLPAKAIQARLEERGLLMRAADVAQIRLFQTLPYLLLLLFGAIKWWIGVSRDKPVTILVVLLVVTGIATLMRLMVIDRATRAGRDALAKAQEREERLKAAHLGAETGMAVALFGTSVLIGSDLWDFHRMRAASSSSGGDSSSDSGGGDGGCGGGGGCGGCS